MNAMAAREPSTQASSQAPLRSRLPAWLWDALAIAVVIVASISLGPPAPPDRVALAVAQPLLVIAALPLVPLRRRWPVLSLACSLALYCAAVIADSPSMGIGIVAVLAAFSVGDRTKRLMTLVAAGLAAAVVVTLSVTISNFGVVEPRVFQIAAGIAVAAALGDSSRSYRSFVVAATERAERAEATREAEAQRRVAEERLRIAQDLHDTVAHQISVINLNAGVAANALEKNPDKARGSLGTIRTASREVLKEIGDLLRYLRTDAAPASTAAPQPGPADIDALVKRFTGAGLAVEQHQRGDLARIPRAIGAVIYRIVQEGLTNAHKHGSSRSASLEIVVREGDVAVTVVNPVSAEGRNQPEPPHSGLGLTGIRERVAAVRGTVHTEPGAGAFTLTAILPLPREDHA